MSRQLSTIETAERLRTIRSDWELFHETGVIAPTVRPEIAASWRRSLDLDIGVELDAVPMNEEALNGFDADGEVRHQFETAVGSLMGSLVAELGDTDAAVGVSLASGALLRVAGAPEVVRSTELRNVRQGGLVSEEDAGTNGVGLALVVGRPVQTIGSEHHLERLHDFTCASAPVRHPVTKEILGTLSIVAHSRYDLGLAPALVARAAADIDGLLQEDLFGRERELLDRYLRDRAGAPRPFLTVDRAGRTIIQNASMLQAVERADVEQLLTLARGALAGTTDLVEQLALTVGTVDVSAHLVRAGREVIGALVSFDTPIEHRSGGRPVTSRVPSPKAQAVDLAPVVGRSPVLRRALDDAVAAARRGMPIVLTGETGTGKQLLATVLHRLRPSGALTVVRCAAPDWPEQWASAVRAGGTIALSRLHALDGRDQVRLADAIDALPEGDARPWVVALLNSTAEAPGPELLERLGRVQVRIPPLRERGADLGLLVDAWCARRDRSESTHTTVKAEAREALAAQPWPGNVRELFNVLDAASLRGGSVIGADALRLEAVDRRADARAVIGPDAAASLDDIEHDAIMRALRRNAGNVSSTAKELGIGRATLTRRLRSYRLRGDGPGAPR